MIKMRELFKSSVYITPELEDISTKRYKVKFWTLFLGIFSYSFILVTLVLGFLYLTPSENLTFLFENREMKTQSEKLRQFEQKVNILSRELAKISANNKNLKYALFLGANDTIDSSHIYYDSLKIKDQNYLNGGNLLAIFKALFQNKEKDKIEFVSPATGYISKEFAPKKGHWGIDFAVVKNSPIVASAAGFVTFSDYTAENGYVIIIEHKNGYISIYKHCSVLIKKERDIIKQGEIIALSGNSGYNTSGPHLHFELWKDGKPINPKTVLVNLNSDK